MPGAPLQAHRKVTAAPPPAATQTYWLCVHPKASATATAAAAAAVAAAATKAATVAALLHRTLEPLTTS